MRTVLGAFAVAALVAGCAAAGPAADADRRAETGALGGTTWRLIDWPRQANREQFAVRTFAFGTDGWMTTTTTRKDGGSVVERESYRVVGNKLIIDRGGRLVDYTMRLQGRQLEIHGGKDWAALGRL